MEKERKYLKRIDYRSIVKRLLVEDKAQEAAKPPAADQPTVSAESEIKNPPDRTE